MATPFFDTLHYVKHLKKSDVSDKQAEAHAQALSDAMNNELVRKTDLNELRTEVKADFNGLRSDFNALRVEVKADINELRSDFNALRVEVKADINELRTDFNALRVEVKADVNELRTDFNALRVEVKGQFNLLKWMLSFLLAGCVAVLLKLSQF